MFRIEISAATRAIQEALGSIPPEAFDAVAREYAITAQKVANDAKRAVQKGTKSGHIYKRGQREHQASAPGEAPASDFGFLASGITSRARGLRAEAGAVELYAPFLELKMDRPFIEPAFEANLGDHIARCKRAVQAVATAAGGTA